MATATATARTKKPKAPPPKERTADIPVRAPLDPKHREQARRVVLAWVRAYRAMREAVAAAESLEDAVDDAPDGGCLAAVCFDQEGADAIREHAPGMAYCARQLLLQVGAAGTAPWLVGSLVRAQDPEPDYPGFADRDGWWWNERLLPALEELGISLAEAGL